MHTISSIEPAASVDSMPQAFVERLAQGAPDRRLLLEILAAEAPELVEIIRQAAEQTLLAYCGDAVRLRGLIEFSNRCIADCYYCGIRRGNRAPRRYTLKLDEIVAAARWCAEQGYGSVVLQSGERRDARFTRFVAEVVRAIKDATRSGTLPQGVGITLSCGEQSPETYAEWFAAGAHRYLLRIESSSPRLFAALHPPGQTLASRIACLKSLKTLGYRVGTGVMIGLPGQSLEDLVDDILFFRDIGADMIGMGPYIPHAQAALPIDAPLPPAQVRLHLALKMIAATRLTLPSINIAASTALETLAPDGREQGLRYGANVVMPQATPLAVRREYTLYDGKPFLDDSAAQCAAHIEDRIAAIGRRIERDNWGDPPHAGRRKTL